MLAPDCVLVETQKELSEYQNEHFIFQQTGIGIVKASGSEVEKVVIGDKVVWLGVELSRELNIPESQLVKIPAEISDDEGIWIGVVAYLIQIVRESGLTFGERVFVCGTGKITELLTQILDLFGFNVLTAEDLKSDGTFCDGLFCYELPTMDIMDKIRAKGSLILLAPHEGSISSNILATKRHRIIYPPRFERKSSNLAFPIGYIRWTVGKDLNLALELIINQKIKV